MTRPSTSPRLVTPALAAALLLALVASGCALTPSAADLAGAGAPDAATAGEQGGSTELGDPAPVPDDVDPALHRFYEQRLEWKSCMDGHFECSRLTVPMDYDEPKGKTLELALLRFEAKNPDKRIGSLVLNPGGPGGSGVSYASYSPGLFSEPVKQRYDLVGMDPRGVGRSEPVQCLSDRQMDRFRATDGSPDGPAEVRQLREVSRQLSSGCVERTGKQLLSHVSTDEVARDLDVLRGALGDEKLNYYGASYGTLLGATYADLFTERVGRMAFDGGLDPTLTDAEIAYGQAKGFERAYGEFLEWCTSKEQDCPLGDNPEEAYEATRDLLRRLDEDPLPTGTNRELTQSLATSAMTAAMYQTGFWYDLKNGLGQALDGNGAALLELADTYAERKPDGSYKNNAGEVIYAVNCLDRETLSGVSQFRAQDDRFTEASPLFGESILWGSLPCASWPVKSVGEPHEIDAEGAPPILVIGTTRDPATPYEWSEALARQLDSGVLLTREGDGHTSNGSGPSQCVQRHLTRFLAQGEPPEAGTVCSS